MKKVIRFNILILRKMSPSFLPWAIRWIVPLILDNRVSINGKMNKTK